MIERHITKDKGDLAVAKTIADLRKSAIYACLPISEHLPFDLIAVMPDMTTLRRVQVKYRTVNKRGVFQIQFRSNYYDSKRIYRKHVDLSEFDCYAAYVPDTDKVYYLRTDEIPENGKSVTFRFEQTLSGRKKDVWMAQHYLGAERIASGCLSVEVTSKQASEQHEIALSIVIADLMEKGIQVMLPQSQFVPFDLVAVMPDMKRLRRMAVTSGNLCPSPYIDDYALYNSAEREVRYFTADQMTGRVKPLTIPG